MNRELQEIRYPLDSKQMFQTYPCIHILSFEPFTYSAKRTELIKNSLSFIFGSRDDWSFVHYVFTVECPPWNLVSRAALLPYDFCRFEPNLAMIVYYSRNEYPGILTLASDDRSVYLLWVGKCPLFVSTATQPHAENSALPNS